MPIRDLIENLKDLPKPSITQLIITVILLYLLSNNVQSLLNYRNGLKRLEDKTNAINQLESKNSEIKGQIANTETSEFLYKAAVDQLNLSKPGEKILILENPNNQDSEFKTNQDNSQDKENNPNQTNNFQKWIKSFNL